MLQHYKSLEAELRNAIEYVSNNSVKANVPLIKERLSNVQDQLRKIQGGSNIESLLTIPPLRPEDLFGISTKEKAISIHFIRN